MGHGDSEGLETTIGFKEGLDVKKAFDFVKENYPEQEIILHGSSMGAVAIMKSIEQYEIKPDKIILECPFGSMLETAKGRFEVMGLPTTPFAQWLILFGGWQTGFDAFAHNPIAYAQKINIPTLLMNGAKDSRVSRTEIDAIFKNVAGEKMLRILPNSAHQIYLTNDKIIWDKAVDVFLEMGG
jgi:alpha-beta hydrolase superfamily lysophospholipase